MRISISSPVRKAAFLGGSITAAVLAWALCWQALAEYLITRNATLESFHTAARLQPLNAYYRRVLGAGLIDTNIAGAAEMLEQSATINPHDAHTWLALSRVYGVLGQPDKQHDAVLKALAADPKEVGVEWDASIYLIQNREIDSGLSLLRDVISNDPSKAAPGMHVAYRATGGDISRTLAAIPATAIARAQFMRWLIDRGDAASADRVWPTIAAAPGNLQSRDLAFYLDSLIARREVTLAKSVWASLQTSDPEVQHRTEPGNLIVNGDFEDNLLNHGLDWRYTRMEGVSVTMDTSTFHGGTRSLALQFDAGDVADAGVYEAVPVDPNTRYSLRGFIHSEELESANGLRLAAVDYYSAKPLMLGEEVLGSTSWREITGDFTTDSDTRLIKISLVRSPASGRIRGKVWVDDLRLESRP